MFYPKMYDDTKKSRHFGIKAKAHARSQFPPECECERLCSRRFICNERQGNVDAVSEHSSCIVSMQKKFSLASAQNGTQHQPACATISARINYIYGICSEINSTQLQTFQIYYENFLQITCSCIINMYINGVGWLVVALASLNFDYTNINMQMIGILLCTLHSRVRVYGLPVTVAACRCCKV